MEFKSFVKKHLAGLQLLTVSLDTYVPGAILDKKSLKKIGHLRDALTALPAKTWKLDYAEANIVYGEITGQKKMRSGVSILGVVRLNGGFSNNYSADYSITDIEGAAFENTSQIRLVPQINAIRKSSKATWKQINGKLVITEAYYAKAFTVNFKKNGRITGKAEIDSLFEGKKHADVDYKWTNSEKLVITNNAKVPFGVRGFVI